MMTCNLIYLEEFSSFLMTMIIGMIFLFSYFFANSRAGRITSNEDYIESLNEASRGRKLAGTIQVEPTEQSTTQSIAEEERNNLFEELWFQIRAVFNV